MSAVTQLPDAPRPSAVRHREAGDALSDLQAYDALSEAADLVARAGRLLRRARHPGLGFHLSTSPTRSTPRSGGAPTSPPRRSAHVSRPAATIPDAPNS